eukprot:1191918-Prorocentrum_minimum.AAC.3
MEGIFWGVECILAVIGTGGPRAPYREADMVDGRGGGGGVEGLHSAALEVVGERSEGKKLRGAR